MIWSRAVPGALMHPSMVKKVTITNIKLKTWKPEKNLGRSKPLRGSDQFQILFVIGRRHWGSSKRPVQQGRRGFGARSVHGVHEDDKTPRTPLAAFSNSP